MAKDGSIHRAPICDMVPEGYHHHPGNGLILRFRFSGHSKKFVLFIYIFLCYIYLLFILEISTNFSMIPELTQSLYWHGQEISMEFKTFPETSMTINF